MGHYAEGTGVSVERSRGEIERTLQRYGATEFTSGFKEGWAAIEFVANNRRVRFVLTLPGREEFRASDRGRRQRTDEQTYRAWEQACRERWRALALAIKAKLEAVASDISTFEEEFMAHMVIPGSGQTVGEIIGPRIAAVYEGKSDKLLLPAPKE